MFATETLALGINMPARTVVIERLDKWNGETHAALTAGEYTQLTGRAGRRGIDVEGHAVVLWQPGIDPLAVAGLAGTRTYPLNSSFQPSYNMAVNLVGQVGRERAAKLLESSFAQFQADRAVVGLARKARRLRESVEGLGASCDRGDFMEYARMRSDLSQLEKGHAKDRSAARRAAVVESLGALGRGDIIVVPGGRRAGTAVVLEPGRDALAPAPLILTEHRQLKRLVAGRVPGPGGRRAADSDSRPVQPEVTAATQGPGLPQCGTSWQASTWPQARRSAGRNGIGAERRGRSRGRGRPADRRPAPPAARASVPRLQGREGARPADR